MCDEKTDIALEEYIRRTRGMSRREFSKLSAAIGAGIMMPKLANAQSVVEQDVDVTTPDGVADCYFVHPASGSAPAVLIWPDIFGLRPAFRQMGRRLAESGYAVLVVNPYYRGARASELPQGSNFQDEAFQANVMPQFRALNADTHFSDARAFISFLDQQDSVDTSRKVGTMGYCMGGPIIMRTAAAVPERVGAAASFHGGGLATDAEDSPHLLIPQMQADMLIAIAENDDAQEPEVKDILRDSFDAAGLNAEIEVYAGTLHGWCPPDSGAYHEEQAERAWSRVLALFETALA